MKAFRNFILLGSILSGWLLGGCAPRYLVQSPESVLAYPFAPVDPAELKSFKTLLAQNPHDPDAPRARFWIAQNEFNSGQWAKAEKLYQQVIKRHAGSEWATAAHFMLAQCQLKLQARLQALTGLNRLRQAHPDQPAVKEAVETLARKVINDDLSLAELAQVRASFPDSDWAEQALFVTGKRQLDEGIPDLAGKTFEQFLYLYPESLFAAMARELLEKSAGLVAVNRNRIGCLVPLSGAYEPYGTAIRQGLELALAQVNRVRDPNEQLTLAVADSLGTTFGAMAGCQQLAEKEKVIAIIGPALSNSVKALLPELDKYRLALITPSAAEPGLTRQSPYFFRYMLTNQDQAAAMAEYVVLRRNLQRVAILHGDAVYDRSLGQAFADRVKELGGTVVAHWEYPQGTTDFKSQLLALGGVDPGYVKEVGSQQHRAMESQMEKIAHDVYESVAPEAAAMAPATVAARKTPGKRVAIIRLDEQGPQAQKEGLGKLLTEKLSYALASKPGLEVSSQAKTFRALRDLELASLDLNAAGCQKLAGKLGIDYLLTGDVTQVKEEAIHHAGEALPVLYKIRVRLLAAQTGAEVKTFTANWTKSILPEVSPKDLDAIYLPVPAHDAVLIASQLAFYDLKAEIFGCDAWMTPKLFREAGPELNGATIAAGFWPDDPEPRFREVVSQFETQFKIQPSLLSIQAYDALQLAAGVLRALDKGKYRREDFVQALAQVHEFQGITGKAAVTAGGEIRREPVFLQIKDKQFQKVQ